MKTRFFFSLIFLVLLIGFIFAIPTINFEEPPTPLNGSTVNSSTQTVVANISDIGNISSWIDFDRSLVGYWAMDYYNSTHVFDNSTYGNNGSFVGGLNYTNLTAGARGQGLMFSGANQSIDVLDGQEFTLYPNFNYTWSMWLKPNDFREWSSFFGYNLDNHNYLIMYSHTSSSSYWEVTNGVAICWVTGASGENKICTASKDNALSTSNFYHVLINYVGSNAANNRFSIYINGTNSTVQRGNLGNLTSFDPNFIYIGADEEWFSTESFNGSLDEVMIFNRSLSETEISALYNSQSNKFNATFTNLFEEQHNYTVYAINDAGEINNSGERNFIVDDPTVLTNCTILSTDNTYYTLQKNVSSDETCFNITAQNVTLDCNGYWINYSINGSAKTYGLYTNQFNTTVKNCNIFDGNWTSSEVDRQGIYFSDSDNSTLFNNFANSNTSNAIQVSTSSEYVNVTKNTGISYTNRGIYISADYSSFINNTGIGNLSSGIYVIGSNNIFINNTFTSYSYYGLEVRFSSNNLFINNTASSNFGTALFTYTITNNTFIYQTAKGLESASWGIDMSTNSNNTIFRDCVNISADNVYVYSNGLNNTFINCSYPLDREVVGTNKELIRKWYYQSYTNYTNGTEVEGANISAYNATGDLQFTELTNSFGYIPRLELIEYINTGGVREYQTPHTVNVTKTGYEINSTVYNLTFLNNVFENIILEEESIDLISPAYISVSHNSTWAGYSTNFSINITDETALEPNGMYVFSTNNTGEWVNDSAVSFTVISELINITKVLNSTVGTVVGYTWYFNDTEGNVNSTEIYTLVTSQGCGVLNITGHTYTLTDNVSSIGTCFNITAQNVTLDCNNYWINYSIGGEEDTYGFYTNQFNTTLENCNIYDGNWTSENNHRQGIYLYTTDNATIFNNFVTVNNSEAVRLYSNATFNNLIFNRFFSNLDNGLILYSGASYNTIINNNITANKSTALFTYSGSSNNIFINNNFTSINGNGEYGIYEVSSINNTYVNNIAYSYSDSATVIYGSLNTTFINHTSISKLGEAIFFYSSNNTLFRDCVNISGGGLYDVYATDSYPNLNNTLINCSYITEYIDGAENYLTRKWYYQAYVKNSIGYEVSGVNISAYNSTGDLQFSELTDSSGWIERQEIIEYVNTGGTISYYNNYTILSNKSESSNDTNIFNFTKQHNKVNDFFTLTFSDSMSPTYSQISHNSSVADKICRFRISVFDETSLISNGAYIFSTNNTGSWVNDSVVLFTASPQSVNVIKILNSDEGKIIGYRWFFNDSVGNRNSTKIYTLTTTDEDDEDDDDDGGGGGGGGGDVAPLFIVNYTQMQEGYEGVFREEFQIRVNLSNKGQHLFKIFDINKLANFVNLSLNNTNYSVSSNNSLKFDFNDDNYYDLEVYVLEITQGNSTRLSFKEIHESIPSEEEGGYIEETLDGNIKGDKTIEDPLAKDRRFIFYIIAGIILIGIFVLGFFILKRIKITKDNDASKKFN